MSSKNEQRQNEPARVSLYQHDQALSKHFFDDHHDSVEDPLGKETSKTLFVECSALVKDSEDIIKALLKEGFDEKELRKKQQAYLQELQDLAEEQKGLDHEEILARQNHRKYSLDEKEEFAKKDLQDIECALQEEEEKISDKDEEYINYLKRRQDGHVEYLSNLELIKQDEFKAERLKKEMAAKFEKLDRILAELQEESR